MLTEQRSHIPLVNVPRKKKARKPMPRVSKKRIPLNRQYLKLREEFLKANPGCEWWLMERALEGEDLPVNLAPPSTEVHHKKGRGKFLLDTSTWMAVSNEGHLAIHADPKRSYEKNYMLPRR